MILRGIRGVLLNNGGRNSVLLGTAPHVPDAPSSATHYAPSWNSTNLEDTLGMLRAEYDLNENWTVYAAAGAKHSREMGQYSSVTLTDYLGNATSRRRTSPADGGTGLQLHERYTHRQL